MTTRRNAKLILCAVAGLCATGPISEVSAQTRGPGVTVHEWGTFTTVAGEDGRAVPWLPLSGPTDLPCFVYHYRNDPLIKVAPGTRRLDYEAARANLWGRVRMETPVLYFYADDDVMLDVRVQFFNGLMTEWYPQAVVTQALVTPDVLRSPGQQSWIDWHGVSVRPGATQALPTDFGDSHYFAARATDAAPLTVNGQSEKFLFYRGVADFDVPLSVEVLDSSIRLTNLGADPLGPAILFENRDGRIGYRVLGTIAKSHTGALPSLDAGLASLRSELERMLVSAGLYPAEARAMVETWRDSWFEEGVRVFYLVPPRMIASILPLTVTPAPAAVTRVFVGRMDVVTPAMRDAIARGIALQDAATLDRYGRLLGPIGERIVAKSTDPTEAARVGEVLAATFARHLTNARICEEQQPVASGQTSALRSRSIRAP